jgi:hypothetical protein
MERGIHEHRAAKHTQMTTHSTSRVWYRCFVSKVLHQRWRSPKLRRTLLERELAGVDIRGKVCS